jgi:phenylpropionate dioxygenase-like ring-hydroxylating dioxygenase large terminal subunit
MLEQQLWHPLVASAQVQADPLSVTLLGQQLVVWRNASKHVHVWLDKCPHRGAKLSLGRVVNNRLECPYHGWQFEAGRCVLVPAQPQWTPPASHCVATFEVRERYGLVWTRLQTPAASLTHELPVFEWEDDANLQKVLCGPYEVATSAPRLVENFLDMTHFSFVHEGWLGSREHTQMPAYDVIETDCGVLAKDCIAVQPQAFSGVQEAVSVSYRYEVRAPYYCLLEKNSSEHRNAIAMFLLPQDHDRSVCWFRMAVTPGNTSDADLISFQNTIFSQDKPIVESQQPKRLPIGLDAQYHELSGPLDRIASAYRRYLKGIGVTVGVC